jgi:hypothetical protein
MYPPFNPSARGSTPVQYVEGLAARAMLAATLLAATLTLVGLTTSGTALVGFTTRPPAVVGSTTTAPATEDPLVPVSAPVGPSVDQLRQDFARRGYSVEPSIDWEWLSPPVTTFRVHDPHRGRALLVQVFADEAVAQTAQQRAAPVPCYASSTWARNVALFQSTEDSLRACMAATAPDGMGPAPDHPRTADLAAHRASVDAEFVSLVLETGSSDQRL